MSTGKKQDQKPKTPVNAASFMVSFNDIKKTGALMPPDAVSSLSPRKGKVGASL